MSASEVRQGPGWWMDSDGSWNPPETWPESTPPLPGWVRSTNGLWSKPRVVLPAPVADPSKLRVSVRNGETVVDLRQQPKHVSLAFSGGESFDSVIPKSDVETAPSLSFSETESKPVFIDDELVTKGRSRSKFALVLIGALIAGLLVLLLLL